MPVDQTTVDRLRAHDWGADPFEPNPGAAEPYRIRLVDNDRCFFLDPDNRCRIHTKISYEAKPPVCRAFPLAVMEVAGTSYARLSFWCPTVTANTGKPLEHKAQWLKDTAKHADVRTAPFTIDGRTEITAQAFDVIHKALRRLLVQRSVPIGDRLAAGAALVYRLNAAAGGTEKVDVPRLVGMAESEGPAALAAEARRGGTAAGGRRVMTLCLMFDWQAGRLAMFFRVVSFALSGLGLVALRSRTVGAKATWGGVQRVAFEPSAASHELLTRYFCSKLDSRRYVAADASLLSGFNLLLAAYGMINVLARMRATSQKRSACNDDDLVMAVGAADLRVVEHSTAFNQDRLSKRLMQLTLSDSRLCADLLALLERGR